jgi:hypothetical protein
LRVGTLPRLPEKILSGIWGELAAHSCGGSRGFGQILPAPHSLLIPRGTDDSGDYKDKPAARQTNFPPFFLPERS